MTKMLYAIKAKGKFTTNLKLHLRKEHSEEYRLLDVEEKKKRDNEPW